MKKDRHHWRHAIGVHLYMLPVSTENISLVSQHKAGWDWPQINTQELWKWKEAFYILSVVVLTWGFPGGSVVKNLPVMQEMQVWSPGREDPLEEEMATHSSILAWEIPWTEDWWATIQRVAKSWIQLIDWTTTTVLTWIYTFVNLIQLYTKML